MSAFVLPPPKLAGGPYVMGVLNVTPDSFSDGGQWEGASAPRGLAMLEAGADIIDVGGESTRPGSEPVDEGQEIARVVPVIAALRAATKAPISIDTMKPAVARAAMQAGASIWNDVMALRSPGALETAASLHRPVVLMHMQGEPRTMQQDPQYDDAPLDVYDYLAARVDACLAAGIGRQRIAIDPGIGFGKNDSHNVAILGSLGLYHGLGCAVLLGVSRKSFVGRLSAGEPPKGRLPGSLAAALGGLDQGVQILRVHDVAETAQARAIWHAITTSGR